MGLFGCCGSAFKTLSRAAAKSTAAKLRQAGVLPVKTDWTKRAELCERCPMRVVRRNVSYCGSPLLEQIERRAEDGCGCPTVAKAKDPAEHCPLNMRYLPADRTACDCRWCVAAKP